MSKGSNVFLIGLMAVGKSTIGRHLAHELGLEFLDSDRVIEERAGADIAWIFDIEGEAGFRERESQVIAELSGHDGIVLATGGGAILDERNRRCLAERGTVIFLETPLQMLFERTRRDKRRPLLANAKDLRQRLEQLAAERTPLYESISDYRFCTDRSSPQAVAKKIADVLRADQRRHAT